MAKTGNSFSYKITANEKHELNDGKIKANMTGGELVSAITWLPLESISNDGDGNINVVNNGNGTVNIFPPCCQLDLMKAVFTMLGGKLDD